MKDAQVISRMPRKDPDSWGGGGVVLALGQNNSLDGFGWVQLDKVMEAGNCTIPVTIVTRA